MSKTYTVKLQADMSDLKQQGGKGGGDKTLRKGGGRVEESAVGSKAIVASNIAGGAISGGVAGRVAGGTIKSSMNRKNVEELMMVEGIGQAKYDGLKDLVTLE